MTWKEQHVTEIQKTHDSQEQQNQRSEEEIVQSRIGDWQISKKTLIFKKKDVRN
jgi:hypothetical protein